MTFGIGAVGPASISSLSKSFRLQLMGRDPNYKDPLDINDFTVNDVAERASKMFAQGAQDAGMTQWPDPPAEGLGYVVVGMSTDCDQAEAWLLKFEGKTLEPAPEEILKRDDYGYKAYAQPEPVNRLFNGYDDSLRNALIQNEIKAGKPSADAEQAIDTFLRPLKLDPVQSGMPLPGKHAVDGVSAKSSATRCDPSVSPTRPSGCTATACRVSCAGAREQPRRQRLDQVGRRNQSRHSQYHGLDALCSSTRGSVPFTLVNALRCVSAQAR
jgi:hypothetical protein